MLRKLLLLISVLAAATLFGGCAAESVSPAPSGPAAEGDTTLGESSPEGTAPDETIPGGEPPQNIPMPQLTSAGVEFREHGSGDTYWSYSYPGVDLVDVERVVDELQTEGLKLDAVIPGDIIRQWYFDGGENMVQLSYSTDDGGDVGGDMYYLIWNCAPVECGP